MTDTSTEALVQELQQFIKDDAYPCVAARAAVSRQHVRCLVAHHMGCPADDRRILEFLAGFVKSFRSANTAFHSAAVIFAAPEKTSEEVFEQMLWQRLQALSDLDAENFEYDPRVSANPARADFSFSIAQEAFFIVGLHPGSSRPSRRFRLPTLIFNPHSQFQELRETNRYEKMKSIVRQRDIAYSGTINPMLADFGEASEAYQYSGRLHSGEWKCPLKINHGKSDDHPTTK